MSSHNRSRIHCLLGLILLGLVLVGCAEVIVTNPTQRDARVRVLLPDGSGGSVHRLKAGEWATEISVVPGRYRVWVLDDADFMKLCRVEQAYVLDLLERGGLSQEETYEHVVHLLLIQTKIEDLAKQGASCSGTVRQEGTVTATLSWDDSRKVWDITCEWQIPP